MLAKRKHWVVEYDQDTDALYWAPRTVPKGSSLVAINREFSVYIGSAGDIDGVLIEYYQHNFVEHNVKFKDFSEVLTGETIDPMGNKKESAKQVHIQHYVDDLAAEIALAVCGRVEKGD